jgi:uncharacterized cupin superfamily protein
MKPIINIDEVERTSISQGSLFAESYATLSDKIGAKKLGYNVTIVPPGKRSCPYHCHHVNEEMFFILEGDGAYRFGNKTYSVKAGDIIAAPPGGAETAHHLINTGGRDLKYLAVSTMMDPDVCEYPDSGKFLVVSGRAPGGDKSKEKLRYIGRTENSLDYWDGETI